MAGVLGTSSAAILAPRSLSSPTSKSPIHSLSLTPGQKKFYGGIGIPLKNGRSQFRVSITNVATKISPAQEQEFVEARCTAGLSNSPSCSWSPSPPLELKGVPVEAIHANAGFVTFVIFPRHVEGKKLDRTVWILSTFHAYVSYHVKKIPEGCCLCLDLRS